MIRDDAEGEFALRITPRGLAAIQVDEGGAPPDAQEAGDTEPGAVAPSWCPGTCHAPGPTVTAQAAPLSNVATRPRSAVKCRIIRQIQEVLASGTFTGRGGHRSTGGVEIVRDGDTVKLLIKSNFFLQPAPTPRLAWGKRRCASSGASRSTWFLP